MSLLLSILAGIYILFGISLLFSSARGAVFAALICIGSGLIAYNEKSFLPFAIGFALLWVLRFLGLEKESARTKTQFLKFEVFPFLFVLLIFGAYALSKHNYSDWSSLIDETESFIARGEFKAAEGSAKRALEISEKKYGPDHINTSTSLNDLAIALKGQGQAEQALRLQERALSIIENSLGTQNQSFIYTLGTLAAIYNDLGQYSKALPMMERALAISEKVMGVEHPVTAICLSNLGASYMAMGLYAKAEPILKRGLEIRETSVGPNHPDTAKSLGNLAVVYGLSGQVGMVLPLLNRALSIYESKSGPNHPDTGMVVNNIANHYKSIGKFDTALAMQQRAVQIYESSLGPNHPMVATNLSNLADMYLYLGLFEKGVPLLQRALDIRENTQGLDHPDTGRAMHSLAVAYSMLETYDAAISLDRKALALLERSLGADHPEVATILSSLAAMYGRKSQFDTALSLAIRALQIKENSLGNTHPETALTQGNLASLYTELGRHKDALQMHLLALRTIQSSYGDHSPDVPRIQGQMGWTLHKMGQNNAAITFLKSAVNSSQYNRETVAKIGVEELHRYSLSISHRYKFLASLLIDGGRISEAQLVLDMLKEDEQFEFIRRSETADPRRTRIGYNATEQAWVSRYRQIADRLAALGAEEQALQKQAKLGLTPEQKQRQQALASDLAVARKAFDSFLAELRETFARQGPARAVEVVETSQQALRETQALLKGLGYDVVLLQYYLTDDKVGMLLTTTGVQLARSSKVNVKDLNRQIAEFRRLLRDPKANAQPTALALYQLLVAPVAQDLEQAGAKTVMLSLDGALRYLPFAALHDGKQYLVQRWNLPMYTSVTKGKLRDAVTPQWQAAGLGLTRAIGGFKALPAVKGEMSSIVKVGNLGVLPGEVYLDEAFNAIRLKDVAQRKFQLLHIASHFQFSPGTEVNSFLLLGDGQQLTLGDIRTQNYRFDNVDLLTLSACDTGLGGGRDANGREIEGFGVIAQQQGAKAVLATLWPVADQSTAELMAEMYRRRQDENLTKIEALRQAQISLMRKSKYSHPFYWAPFILMGNWK